MKHCLAPVAIALTLAFFLGCSRQPYVNDLGVVKASDGVSCRYLLPGGTVCVIKPTFYNDGKAGLFLSATRTNWFGLSVTSDSLQTQIAVDQTTIIALGKNTIISLTLLESK
jgi:hypothetical protein